MRTRFFSCFVLILFTFSFSYAQNQAKVYRFAASNCKKLKVIGYSGTVKLMGRTGLAQGVIHVVEKPSPNWHDTVTENAGTVTVQIFGPTDSKQWNSATSHWPPISITVLASSVPAEIDWHHGTVVVENWNASLKLSQIQGEAVLKNGNGPAHISLQLGKVAVLQHQGGFWFSGDKVNLTANQVHGPLDIDDFNGNVDVSQSVGPIRYASNAGEGVIEKSQGSLDFKIDSGRIVAKNFSGEVRGTSQSGAILARLGDPSNARVASKSGRIELWVPSTSSASYDIQTSTGHLYLKQPLFVHHGDLSLWSKGELGPEGQGFLYVRTDSGDVFLK